MPEKSLSDDFVLNEIVSLNNAANGLVQTNLLVMGAYIVFAWALIEKLGEHQAKVAQKLGIAVIANATNVTSMQEVTSLFFTRGFIFYSIFIVFILMPLVLWAWSISSVRANKEPLIDSDLSSTKLRLIFKQKHDNYCKGQDLSLLGFFVAALLMSIFAGIFSSEF